MLSASRQQKGRQTRLFFGTLSRKSKERKSRPTFSSKASSAADHWVKSLMYLNRLQSMMLNLSFLRPAWCNSSKIRFVVIRNATFQVLPVPSAEWFTFKYSWASKGFTATQIWGTRVDILVCSFWSGKNRMVRERLRVNLQCAPVRIVQLAFS